MFISDSIKTDVVTITPRLARQLLEQNTGNRKFSPTNLAKVKTVMERGEWTLNGEAVKISKSGRILDGQHRLRAAVETETTFETLLVYGLEDEAQETMDSGKSRTLADILSIRGYKSATATAAITLAIIRSEMWSIRAAVAGGANAYTVTNRQALDRLEREATIADIPKIIAPVRKVGMSGKTAGLLYYVFSGISSEDADHFFEKLTTGADMDRGDPILTLRNLLIAARYQARGEINQTYIAAVTIKAWNRYRAGEGSTQLRFRVGGANPETFPEPR